MNILLLAPIHRRKEFLKQKEKSPFVKGQGQESWLEALERLGHTVQVFRYTDTVLVPEELSIVMEDVFQKISPRWYARYRKYNNLFYFLSLESFLKNKKLLHIVESFTPDVIFISGGIDSIYPHTIQTIKNKFTSPVFLFSGINPIIGASAIEKIMVQQKIVDIVVENDSNYAEQWRNLGAQDTIVLPISSVDSRLHQRIKLTSQEKKLYGSPVCFAGTLTKKRQEQLIKLRDFDLKIWGDIPLLTTLDPLLKPFYKGLAFGEELIKIFNASDIVINFQPVDMNGSGNMRTFEITGCGAFEMTDKLTPEWFVEDKEIVIFKNTQELVQKIRYYLHNEKERKKIADNGYKKAHTVHTYEKHFKTLLSKI